MGRRITIQWTDEAKKQLAKLPLKVRRGLKAKAQELRECTDPASAHKPLVGPFSGFFRFTYARYRALYSVEEETLATGDVLVHIKICMVAVGLRKERDRKDIYRIAKKMIDLGLVKPANDEEGESSP